MTRLTPLAALLALLLLAYSAGRMHGYAAAIGAQDRASAAIEMHHDSADVHQRAACVLAVATAEQWRERLETYEAALGIVPVNLNRGSE